MKTLFCILIALSILVLPLSAQNVEWTNRYTGPGNGLDEAAHVVTSAGMTVVTGSTFDNGWDIVTMSLSPAGDTLWTRTYDGGADEKAAKAFLDPRGIILVLGYTYDAVEKRLTPLFLAYTPDGTEVSASTAPLPPDVSGVPVDGALLANGSYAFLVRVTRDDGFEAAAIVVIDISGNELWSDVLAFGSGTIPMGLAVKNNDVTVCGTIRTAAGDAAGLAWYDANGTRLFVDSLDASTARSAFTHIGFSPDGQTVYAAGWSMPDSNTMRPLIASFSSSGAMGWSTDLPTLTDDLRVTGFAVDASGRPIATCRSTNAGGDITIATFALKAADGTIDWSQSWNGPGTQPDINPPIFAGASGGRALSISAGMLSWPAALDDASTPDEIRYRIYAATTSGGQNFTSPTATVTGRQMLRIDGLQPGSTNYYVVRAVDRAGNEDSNLREVRISLAKEPIVIITTTLPDGQVGLAYTAAFTAMGGTAPYSWQVITGSLPPGIQVAATGELSGTPTAAGTFPVTMLVTDAASDTASKAFSIFVMPTGLSITTVSVPDGSVNVPYFAALTASGGQTPYTWSLAGGALPDGLQIDPAGSIGGTPTTPGSFSFTARVTDANSDSASKIFPINISGPAAQVFTRDTTLPAGRHCYPSVIIRPNVTLRFTGPATLCATDSIVIAGRVMADCHALVLEYLHLLITGTLDNRCSTDSANGGALTLTGLQGDFSLEGGSIQTHGYLTITDDTSFALWNFAVPPDAVSKTKMDPVGSITADVLADNLPPGESVPVIFEATGADPDGGPVHFSIDFGDGDSAAGIAPEDEQTAHIEKNYTQPGTYFVRLTITDDESATSVVTAQVYIADSSALSTDGLGLAIEAGDPIVPVGDSIGFVMQAEFGSEPDTIAWSFGDGGLSSDASPVHAYSAAGRYEVRLHHTDDSANTADASMYIYAYVPDTTAVAGGSTGSSLVGPDRVLQGAPWNINGPIVVPRGGRIVRRGARDINVGPGGNINAPGGPNGVPGQNGGNAKGGGTLHMWAGGDIRFAAGANMRSPNGGNGAANPNGSKGGNGADGGSLRVTGRNIVINGGTFAAGDGGSGGNATKNVPASGTAIARGGKGGDAGKSVSFHATRCITFNAPAATIHVGNGGAGGNGDATGGPGQDKCPTGQDGGNGVAYGGKGGNAQKKGIVTGCVVINAAPTITGGLGGDGGNGTANGGRGGDALACKTTARGGKGGYANGLGGDGGSSGYSGPAFPGTNAFRPGDGGDGTSNPGRGGNADAIPDPDPGADGCPGQKGGDTDARGGKAGRGYSINGARGTRIGVAIPAVSGNSTANGANGGNATALGGKGGNGVGCNCAGGPGGEAVANGGDRSTLNASSKLGGTKTKNEGADGNATATGGAGGKGGDCCSPPGPSGGPGGKGGNSTANAGPNGGTYNSTGGKGGNGGDGKGPGPGGAGGTAEGKVNGAKTDGANGILGNWCFVIKTWFLYFGISVPGTIPPGTRTLDVYKDQDAIPANKVGEISVEFAGQLQQSPTGGVVMQPGSYIHLDPKTFTGGDPNPPNGWPSWFPHDVSIDITNMTQTPQAIGLRGFNGGDVLSEMFNTAAGGIGSTETLSVAAMPLGTTPDRFDFFGFFCGGAPVSVYPWITFIWIDP